MKEDELSVSNASNTRQLCLKLNLHHKSKCNEKELQNKKRFCREPYAHIPRHGKQVRIEVLTLPYFLTSSIQAPGQGVIQIIVARQEDTKD